ncbi:MAG: peptidase [Nitrosopumilus sp.]|nr:peptidase [Nitrosopumilus sp.]
MKIFSTLFRSSESKILFLFVLLFLILVVPQVAYANVYVPLHEYLGYFDSTGIYTVVGNVKNENHFAIIPTITVSVIDDSKTISKTIKHVPLGAGKEIPFKIKFPELTSNTPILMNPEIIFDKTIKNEIPIQVLYDKTLIKHSDGHISGRIQNTGEKTIYYPKIYAVVHGYELVLDITQNIEFIEKIEPEEIVEFSMYPDPSITADVFYYSCFAPVDTTVIPVTAKKNGGEFDFRYDSGAWYSAAEFSNDGTTLTMRGYNSYPLQTYANFEFPPITGKEKFDVTINDKPIEFIQSVDEMDQWHVAFIVEPHSQGILKITGFEKGLPPEIPQWIKINAKWWISDQISDSEFMKGIDFLFKKGTIFVADKQFIVESDWYIPSWFKTTALWWSEEKISDDDLLNAIENLVKQKIIVI